MSSGSDLSEQVGGAFTASLTLDPLQGDALSRTLAADGWSTWRGCFHTSR